jgi:hypothetical protein
MSRVESLTTEGIEALFAAKTAEDATLWGTIGDVAANTALVASQGITIATHTSQIATHLANINANATDIATNAANITATRATVCTSTTRPTTGLFVGKLIRETDTKAYGYWDGSAWVMFDTVMQDYTPTWTVTAGSINLGTGGYILGEYRRIGKVTEMWMDMKLGSGAIAGGSAGAIWRFSMPSTPRTFTEGTNPIPINNAYGIAGGAGKWTSGFAYHDTASYFQILLHTDATNNGLDVLIGGGTINGAAITNACQIRAHLVYEAA